MRRENKSRRVSGIPDTSHPYVKRSPSSLVLCVLPSGTLTLEPPRFSTPYGKAVDAGENICRLTPRVTLTLSPGGQDIP